MEARWGGKVEITKKTNNKDQVIPLNVVQWQFSVFSLMFVFVPCSLNDDKGTGIEKIHP